MNRRKQLLSPSAPDFLYKEASSESYDPVKSPKKPLATGAFRPEEVKKSLPALYQKLVGMVYKATVFSIITLIARTPINIASYHIFRDSLRGMLHTFEQEKSGT